MKWPSNIDARAQAVVNANRKSDASITWNTMAGFHIRRGDMKALRTAYYGNDDINWTDEISIAAKHIIDCIDQNMFVFIATDDSSVFDDLTRLIPEHNHRKKIFFNSLGQEWIRQQQHGTGPTPPSGKLRETSLSDFMTDLYILSRCHVLFGCRFSSVKHILRAIRTDKCVYTEIGSKSPQAWNGVSIVCQRFMIQWLKNNFNTLLIHSEYDLPHFTLTPEHVHILQMLTVPDLEDIYQQWSHSLESMWFKYGIMFTSLSRMSIDSLTQKEKMHALRSAWENINKPNKVLKPNGKWARHHPGFMTALLWTRMRWHLKQTRRTTYLSIGDQVVKLHWKEVTSFAYWVKHMYESTESSSFNTSQWQQAVKEYLYRNDAAWKTIQYRYMQNAHWTTLKRIQEMVPEDPEWQYVDSYFESWQPDPIITDDDASDHSTLPPWKTYTGSSSSSGSK